MAKQTKQNKIMIDHVENSRLIKELQSEDWKIVRGMEKFLVALSKVPMDNQPMTVQQFVQKYLKDAFDVGYYQELHDKRQGYRDSIINKKDIDRLEAKVEQLKVEKEKLMAQVEYFDKAQVLELPMPFSLEQKRIKVERISQIGKELAKYE